MPVRSKQSVHVSYLQAIPKHANFYVPVAGTHRKGIESHVQFIQIQFRYSL
jgi:hypothetical protein